MAGPGPERLAQPAELAGPVVQSIAIGFRVLFAAIGVLAVAWVASNWRQVPAESQAVVLRFGRIVGVQPSGLVVSWPRPVGQVMLVPGPARLLTLRTETTARRAGLEDVFTQASGIGIPQGAGSYLTGDGGVVLLAATIGYQVTDGAAYALAQSHVEPALRRLFEASAVAVAARRALDDFLVTGAGSGAGAGADPARVAATENRRQGLRADLVREMNRRLADLDGGAALARAAWGNAAPGNAAPGNAAPGNAAPGGAALGVAVRRVDLDSALPPAAKIAYDGVLVAAQLAEQGIAGARTEATRMQQEADRERDRLLAAARASAAERVADASAKTAAIVAIRAGVVEGPAREAMLDQVYRDQLALLMRKVGRVTAVDAGGGARVILPATLPAGNGR